MREVKTTLPKDKKKQILDMVKDIKEDCILDYLYVLVEDAYISELTERNRAN